ncbi:MAG TPA: MFS transporter [Pseudolabrys sp.]|jgi:MFS family permease
MTQLSGVIGSVRRPYIRIVGAVSAAHFISHYYIIVLAPLLPFVRDEYRVTYTQIGLAFTAFNIVTALFQTPAGFLVDKLGAHVLLVLGLTIGAAAFTMVGLVDSFWVMVAMFGVAGIGNTVYHPANYALLSQYVPSDRIGQAFSIHTFAGMLGSAVAPASLLMMESVWGWRGAFIGAGFLGLAVAILLLAIRDGSAIHPATSTRAGSEMPSPSWKLLLSTPILLNLAFFVLLAMMSSGLYNYSVVALGALYGTPVTTANAALTGNLLFSAAGVLMGGVLVTRVKHHGMVATLGLIAMALSVLLIAQVDLGSLTLIAAMSLGGLFSGIIMPSRDMIVRDVTPAGSFGKVFGFVTTGFNIGGIVSPLIFGAVMDHENPRLVFLLVAIFSLLAIFTVAIQPRRAAH